MLPAGLFTYGVGLWHVLKSPHFWSGIWKCQTINIGIRIKISIGVSEIYLLYPIDVSIRHFPLYQSSQREREKRGWLLHPSLSPSPTQSSPNVGIGPTLRLRFAQHNTVLTVLSFPFIAAILCPYFILISYFYKYIFFGYVWLRSSLSPFSDYHFDGTMCCSTLPPR